MVGDAGVAVVEFVMISGLLVLMLFGVLQLAAVLYVRTVVAASAADGTRYAASAGVSPAAGAARAHDLIARALSPAVAAAIPCTSTVTVDGGSGLRIVQVRCAGRIRSIFVPAGRVVTIRVQARSLDESP